jgi:catechol 2,3-dioxygenase-like lactoylglutathione lyase family enzyme
MTADAGAGARIGPIAGVTIATPDLAASEAAYIRHLGYRVTGRGQVSAAQAGTWERPAAAGSRYVTLSPERADDFQFRFIEIARPARPYRAFSSFGWNAAELIVRDVDALAPELVGSGFEVLGPPQDLSFTDAIRAMQVRGPAGEILYLTQFKRDLPSLPAPPARCKVDRVFIVIVGGPSLDELLAFYTRRFGVPEPQRMESRVKAMSEAFGLSPEARYQIAALPLQARCYIEADQMPAAAAPPASAPGQLPPGIAIVSFAGHGGSGTSCVAGPAGEIIEQVAAA